VFVQDRRVPNLDHSDPLWVGDKKPTIRHTLETQISPGVSDEVVCIIDLAASSASLTGTNLPTDACLDSLNVADAMLGKPNAKGRDHLIQQDNGQAGKFGSRVGDWKLQSHDSNTTRNRKVEATLQDTGVAKFQLFDLANDPGETKVCLADYPAIAKRMQSQVQSLIALGRTRD